MSNYKIFTDSACDLTKEMRKKYDLDYFRMGITVDGVDYPCDLNFEAFSSDQLYNWVGEETHTIKTSLIQMQDIIDRTKKYLDEGKDILYIACTSKLSGSWNIFRIVAQELEEDYPITNDVFRYWSVIGVNRPNQYCNLNSIRSTNVKLVDVSHDSNTMVIKDRAISEIVKADIDAGNITVNDSTGVMTVTKWPTKTLVSINRATITNKSKNIAITIPSTFKYKFRKYN